MSFAICHSDLDGFGCALILALAKEIDPSSIRFCSASYLSKILNQIPDDVKKLYICDFCLPKEVVNLIKNLADNNVEIIIIDHHTCETDEIIAQFTRIYKDQKATATEIAYKLFQNKITRTDLVDFFLYAASKMDMLTTDFVVERIKDEFTKVDNEILLTLHSLPSAEKLKALKALLVGRLNFSDLTKWLIKYERRRKGRLEEAFKKVKIRGNLAILETDDLWVTPHLLRLKDVQIAITFKKVADKARISIRCRNEFLVDIVVSLLRNTESELSVTGTAIGGWIDSSHLTNFIERLEKSLRKLLILRKIINLIDKIRKASEEIDLDIEKQLSEILKVVNEEKMKLI